MKKAIRELNNSEGSSLTEILHQLETYPNEERPTESEVKQYLKMACDVNILEVHAKRYKLYVKKRPKKRKASVANLDEFQV